MHAAGVEFLTEPRTEAYSRLVVFRDVASNQAQAFVEGHSTGTGTGGQRDESMDGGRFVELDTWQFLRDMTHDDLDTLAVALLVVGTMLAGLTIATAAVLVAGRMATQIRQVGTLKAVGVTPGQVTCVLLVEYLILAGTAAIVDLPPAHCSHSSVGPRSEQTLYGAPQAPPITWARAGITVAVAIAVVVLATVRPSLRGARRSTLRSLATDVRPPKRVNWLARTADALHLPPAAALGLRSALRRPGRTVIHTIGLTLGVAMLIMGLALENSRRR
jgi:putative ABC transport system permease protein